MAITLIHGAPYEIAFVVLRAFFSLAIFWKFGRAVKECCCTRRSNSDGNTSNNNNNQNSTECCRGCCCYGPSCLSGCCGCCRDIVVSLLLIGLWIFNLERLWAYESLYSIYQFIIFVGILLFASCVTKIYRKCKPADDPISFWRGYWPSFLIFSACSTLAWPLIAWELGSSHVHDHVSDEVWWWFAPVEITLLPVGNIMIHIVFIMRLVQWRKTNTMTNTDSEATVEDDMPDDDAKANTNTASGPESDGVITANSDADTDTRVSVNGNANCKGIHCMDLYFLLIGSSLSSPIVIVIKISDLYAALGSFLALVIFAVVGKCIMDCCCRQEDPSNPSTQATDDPSDISTGRASTKGRKYPKDSYSFLAVYSPMKYPNLFCFGLMVFVFQFALLALLITSIVRTASDNPSDGWFAYFIPANATQYVRTAQFLAIFAFVVFKDSNLDDITVAIELYPRLFNLDNNEKSRLAFSCTLRLLQGMISVTAVALLVMTSSNVLDIILNFTAVNFVSQLDNIAFEVAMSGKFGPTMESAAKKSKGRLLPEGVVSKSKHRRYMAGIASISIILLLFVGWVVTMQESGTWATQSLKVQFDGERFAKYSGCYNTVKRSQNKRQIYRSGRTELQYCAKEEKWLFFERNVLLSYFPRDPCKVLDDKREIAHSPPTGSFDISDSFGGTWFSSSNIPVVLYFLSTNVFDEVEGAEPVVCNEIDSKDLKFLTDFSYFDRCK